MIDPSRLALAKLLHREFPLFAKHCLKIRTKDGKAAHPFELNPAQLYIHERVEDQKRRTGKVRVIILKGRQQGASTYTEGRFYWLTATRPGVRTLIVAHEQVASDNLFSMARRYHDNMPEELRPSIAYSNAKELVFGRLDSAYKVLTAGSKDVGRGNTVTLLHASEFAFWSNAAEHMAGLAQAVADADGTEVIIESTAKGMGNEFHKKVQMAIAGKGEYELIFIPWFWTTEYRKTVPADWVRTAEEEELADLYRLDDEQLAWRRHKIETDFAGDVIKFLEEYPNCVDDAFQSEKRETFIRLHDVVAARRCMLPEPSRAPLVIGVDPARFGDDRTTFAWRRGRELVKLMAKKGIDTMQTAGIVVDLIRKSRPKKVFIDVIGIGAGVVDRLLELGYGEIVMPVNFANTANDETRYRNKRAECWGEMRDWLAEKPCSIPDSDALQLDLMQPGFKYDSQGRYQLESKDEIRKRDAPSPDLADAVALTFAEHVSNDLPKSDETSTMPADRIGGY